MESDAPELYRIAVQIAQLTNSCLFWDMRQMDDVERQALIAELLTEWAEIAS